MPTSLCYAIKYVANMDRAVEFHRDEVGLTLKFQSPGWSEFETGQTTLALHISSPEHVAGTCELGFRVADVAQFYSEKNNHGIAFVSPPTELHGQRIARFKDSDGAGCSVSSPVGENSYVA